MNWTEAIEAMKRGARVQRKSEQHRTLISDPDDDMPVYECGEEEMHLATAYTVDGQFVRVFQGSGSKVLFEPEDRHTQATDWVEVMP